MPACSPIKRIYAVTGLILVCSSRVGISVEDLAAFHLPCGDEWVPGVHYAMLEPTPPPIKGKVEVIQMSMYTTWAATAEFKAQLKTWLDQHASTVEFLRLPSVAYSMPHARIQALMFHTLEELGRADLHDELDVWVQTDAHWPIYHNIWEPNEKTILKLNLAFAKRYGIDLRHYQKAYYSDKVRKLAQRSEASTDLYAVTGTPTYVINRRYSIMAQRLDHDQNSTEDSFARLLRLLDYLVKSEGEGGCVRELEGDNVPVIKWKQHDS